MFMPLSALGQDLTARLKDTVAAFNSAGSSTVNQLIELAQCHNLPMGIEWLVADVERPEISALPVRLRNSTIERIIQTILQAQPDYAYEVKNGVIHIYPQSFAGDGRNFLNLQLPQVTLKDENLSGVSYLLRTGIEQLLDPTLGRNGGFGYDSPRSDGFDLRKVNLSASNVAVREVLSRAVSMQGNALWLVYLQPTQIVEKRFGWQFIALKPNYIGEK